MSLALFWLCKFGLAQICEDFLKNMDNKSFKKQRKTASSSYPPRSLNKKVNLYKACIYGLCRDFLDGVGYDLGTKFYCTRFEICIMFLTSCSI